MKGKALLVTLLIFTFSVSLFTAFYMTIFHTPRSGSPGKKADSSQSKQNVPSEQLELKEPMPQEPIPQVIPHPSPAPPPPSPAPQKKEAPREIILGSFQTSLIDRDDGRITNIRLASKKINGYVLRPGGIFSFNEIVGERTPEKGYKKSKVIINGKYGEEIGGGICQLSTTLYNSARKADMDIVERHPHSRKVSYAPEGYDATVSYGYLDFKFRNSKSYPVLIRTGIKNGKVYVLLVKRDK